MDLALQHKANVDKILQMFNDMENEYPDSLYIVELNRKRLTSLQSPYQFVNNFPVRIPTPTAYLGRFDTEKKGFFIEELARNAVAWSVKEMRVRINILALLIEHYDFCFNEINDIELELSSSPHIDSLAFIN